MERVLLFCLLRFLYGMGGFFFAFLFFYLMDDFLQWLFNIFYFDLFMGIYGFKMSARPFFFLLTCLPLLWDMLSRVVFLIECFGLPQTPGFVLWN